MAKTRIYDLSKEVGRENKEVLAYLMEQGVDVKSASSSVEDTVATNVRSHFGGASKSSAKENEAPKAEKPAEKPVQKTEAQHTAHHETKPAQEQAAKPQKQDQRPQQRPQGQQGQGGEPKKKKKIIIVSGNAGGQQRSGYSAGGDNRRPSGQNNNFRGGNRNSGFSAAQNAYRPIKPLTVPSQVESYDSAMTRTAAQAAADKENMLAAQAQSREAERKQAEAQQAAKQAEAEKAAEQAAAQKAAEQKSEAAPQQTQQAQAPAAQTAAPSQDRQNRPQGQQGQNRDHQTYGNRGGAQGGRPSYGNGQGGRSYNNSNGGQGRPYNNGGQGRPYGQGGQGRPYNNGGQGRPFNNNGGQGGRPGFGGQGGRPGFGGQGGRPGFGGQGGRPGFGGQGGRPGFGGQGRPGAGAGAGAGFAGGKPGEKSRDDRRRMGADRDKRKKDLAMESDEKMTRSKRVGRFIKPEVRKEEAPEEKIKVISIPEKLTIKELAEKMKLQPSVIIKKLFLAGQIVTVNSELTYEEAENIAIEYEIICEKEVQVDVIEELLKEEEEDPKDLVSRPPVVCVMGHVDHGKTSLLDAIRNTGVADKEAGGITQRIGAYMVSVKGRKITFLDTPGHEAFTAMRMRGANSTDIAVLVVAADDGVMPQTVEAINHAKAANVEIIVAVNKMDKPNANMDRVKQEMTEYGLIATDWGGSTEFVPVSAKTNMGIDNLLETIILTADILELKANPNRQARGLVLEARLDKGRGPVANVLVQKGTLHVGDFISAGACSGKVRAMSDDKGRHVREATPSEPVEILGLSDVPAAGEVFLSHESDKEAKQYANTYMQQHKKDLLEETKAKMSLDDLYSKIEEGKLKELDIIIKADVQGSVEALKTSLLKLSNEEVMVKVIHGGVGAINESDVSLASASNAIIIGFDVRPDAMAKSTAEREGVEIKLYKVIYQAIDDVEAAMKGMLAPIYEEKVTGHAEIRQIFHASAIGNIAGAYITDGSIKKECKVRVKRGEEQVFEGPLASLKRFKDDVKEVKEGYECGLVFDGFDAMNEGDIVEAYIMVEVPRT